MHGRIGLAAGFGVVALSARLVAQGAPGAQGARVLRERRDAPSEDAAQAAAIDQHDRLARVRALVTGAREATVVVATRLGAMDSAVAGIESLGGRVAVCFAEVGYTRVRIPLAQLDRLRALPWIVDVAVDDGTSNIAVGLGTDPSAADPLRKTIPRRDTARLRRRPPLPAAALTRDNPYIPTGDMGVPSWRAAHPTFDGRGVTIAVVAGSGALDFAHASLRRARSLSGDSIAKLAGLIDSRAGGRAESSPGPAVLTVDTLPDAAEVEGRGIVDASDGTFVLDGRRYEGPHPGRFAVGLYHPDGGGRPYAVAWDRAAALVWIDTNRDGSFRDEVALPDINHAFAFTRLRPDSGAVDSTARVAVAVAFDSGGDGVRVYEARSWHETMVAATAAGTHLLGGAADGVAPGARILIVDASWVLGPAIEAFVRAERDPRVDIITTSSNWEVFPSSGQSIFSLILERAIARYGKPVFAAAQNGGPLTTTTNELGATPGVVAVGASVSRATYRADFGWDMPRGQSLVAYSSLGPSQAGALKPDIVAPAISMTALPCSYGRDNTPTVFTIPLCWQMGGGTSNATPMAAGVAALLVSGAKQRHLPADAAHIAWAMRMAARPLPGYAVHEQGRGLLDVGRAWALLERAPAELPVIEVRAPVRTRLARYLRTPGEGVGLYEREGWAPGDTGTRVVTLTRRSGPAAPVRYALDWLGSDGTFTGPAAVTLPRDVPVRVELSVRPRSAGVHSAALRLIDPVARMSVQDVLLTVVASRRFTSAGGYTVRDSAAIAWPRSRSIFVDVPPGTSVLRVALHVLRGRYKLRVDDPDFDEVLHARAFTRPARFPTGAWTYVTTGQTGVELFPAPRAGVWELVVEPFDQPDHGASPVGEDSARYHVDGAVDLTASIVGAEAVVAEGGPRDAGHVTWGGRWGPLGRPEVVAGAGVRRENTVGLTGGGDPVATDVVVDSGAATLRLEATPADTNADVDAYLYDCARGSCVLTDYEIGGSGARTLLVRSPRPGLWRLVLDPARTPNGLVMVRVGTILTGTRYGTVDASREATAVGADGQWGVRCVLHPRGSIAEGQDRVIVADLIDAVAEAAERRRPLAIFGGPPYRPAIVGTAVMPVEKGRGAVLGAH